MRSQRAVAAMLLAAGVAALAGCASGQPPAFHPAGSLPGRAALPSAPAGRVQGGFRFPAGVSVEFSSPLASEPPAQAVVAGYRAYVRSLWEAVLSHGRDTRYRQFAAGNALSFVRREAAYYRAHGQTVRGRIRYFGTKVTRMYFGGGADVTSCVDASQFHAEDSSGAVAGPVFPARFTHYLEDVAEGRRANGTWFVTHTDSYPATSSEGATCA